MPDTAVAEVDKPVRIDVLANDIGLPGSEQQIPALQIEGSPQCGRAVTEGRVVVYTASTACVGMDITFGYSLKVGEDFVTGLVSVTVRAPSVPEPETRSPEPGPEVRRAPPPESCEMPGLNWSAVQLRGGVFSKADAPPAIVDLVELLDEPQFSVQPFCMTVEAAPADVVDPYFDRFNAQERHDRFPEMQNTASVFISRQDPSSRMAARVSQRMAQAFIKWAGEKSGRQLVLPSLEEYVAAAWELSVRQPRSPEADAFLVTLRNGNLQWTRSACGASGSFWLLGPGAQGRLVKLCYEQSRLDRTGFRLSVR